MNYDYDYGSVHNFLLFSGENDIFIFDGKQSRWMNKIDTLLYHTHHTHVFTHSLVRLSNQVKKRTGKLNKFQLNRCKLNTEAIGWTYCLHRTNLKCVSDIHFNPHMKFWKDYGGLFRSKMCNETAFSRKKFGNCLGKMYNPGRCSNVCNLSYPGSEQ